MQNSVWHEDGIKLLKMTQQNVFKYSCYGAHDFESRDTGVGGRVDYNRKSLGNIEREFSNVSCKVCMMVKRSTM